MFDQTFRRGDMVTAKVKNNAVPMGTTGIIRIAPSQPTIPRSLYVEWQLTRPVAGKETKSSWHHDTELSPLHPTP